MNERDTSNPRRCEFLITNTGPQCRKNGKRYGPYRNFHGTHYYVLCDRHKAWLAVVKLPEIEAPWPTADEVALLAEGGTER